MSPIQRPDDPSPRPVPVPVPAAAPIPEPEGPVAPFTKAMFQLQDALGGRYAVRAELGKGGMGVVYLAREVALNRLVAIKILPPAKATEQRRERFVREARLAAQLTHQHIVRIYGVEEAGPFVCYVMEYIKGETVAQRIERRGKLPVGEATRILHEVADAVRCAHEHGIIHRDLKPQNILLDDQGRAHVVDFGIARALDEIPSPGAGHTFGSYKYMSPEQAAAKPTDHRSDIYSLGALGYAMAMGVPPFLGTMEEVLEQHITTPAPVLTAFNQYHDQTLMRAVARCLAKRPDDRYQSAAELDHDLVRAPELTGRVPDALGYFVERLKRITSGAGVPAALAVAVFLSGLAGALLRSRWGDAVWELVGLGLAAASPVLLALPALWKVVRAGVGQLEIIDAITVDMADQASKAGGGDAGGTLRKVLETGSKVLKVITMVTWTVAILGLVVMFFWPDLPEFPALIAVSWGGMIGLAAALLRMPVEWFLARPQNARWLQFWGTAPAGWLVELMGIAARPRKPAFQRQPAALPAAAGSPRLRDVLQRSDTCIRRGERTLEDLTARGRAGKSATADQSAVQGALAARLAELRGRRERLRSGDAASDPGSVTRDIEAALELCTVIDALIEGLELGG